MINNEALIEYKVPFSVDNRQKIYWLSFYMGRTKYTAEASKATFDLLNFKTKKEYIIWLAEWRKLHTHFLDQQKEIKKQLRYKKNGPNADKWVNEQLRSEFQSTSSLLRDQLRALYMLRVRGKALIKMIEQSSLDKSK